jgi:hypothetical protein
MCIYIYISMIIPWIYILQAWLYIYNYIYRYIYVPAYTCILGRFIVLYLYSFGSLSRLVNGVVHCNFLSIFYTYIHVIEDRTVFSYYNSESLLLYPSGVTLCMWCAYIYIWVLIKIQLPGKGTIADQPRINRDPKGDNRGGILFFPMSCV